MDESKQTMESEGVPEALVAISEQDLEAVVAHINRIVTAKGLETARTLGNYLLETFFDNDPAKVHERGSGKVATFRKLAARKDLHCSFNVLWNSVAVVEQLRLLPENLVDSLPMSHHKLLLPVKSAEKKVQLAREAVEKNLGKREFEERVAKVKAKQVMGEKRGRKPDPEPLKKLKRLSTALAAFDLRRLTPDRLRGLTDEQAREYRLQLHEAWERIGALREALAKAEYPESAE